MPDFNKLIAAIKSAQLPDNPSPRQQAMMNKIHDILDGMVGQVEGNKHDQMPNMDTGMTDPRSIDPGFYAQAPPFTGDPGFAAQGPPFTGDPGFNVQMNPGENAPFIDYNPQTAMPAMNPMDVLMGNQMPQTPTGQLLQALDKMAADPLEDPRRAALQRHLVDLRRIM